MLYGFRNVLPEPFRLGRVYFIDVVHPLILPPRIVEE